MSSSNTVIQILRSYTNATPANLADGEMAYSFVSNTLFIGDSNNEIIPIGGISYIANIVQSSSATSFDGGTF